MAALSTRMYPQHTVQALHALWRTLPVRGVTDFEGVLDDYCFALDGFSRQAVVETVQKLRRGEIEDASKEFCPKAPKLAEYVRREETRLRQLSRPALPSVPARTDFKDWRIIHREKAAAEGRELIQRGASLDDFKRGIKNGTYPLGSTWYWSMGVYGPAKGQAA